MKAYAKNCLREIRGSAGRFAAILAITALGVGLFSGLCVSKEAMVETAQRYLDESAFYDLRAISTLGWEEQDLELLRGQPEVALAEGSISADFICAELDGAVLHAMTVGEELNKTRLLAGRMPASPNECLADSTGFSEADIGRVLTLSPENGRDTFDAFVSDSFTIVGLCDSPLYMSFDRGTTAVGSGKVAAFLCLPRQAFSSEIYTELYVALKGAGGGIYTEEYEESVERGQDALEPFLTQRAQLRYSELRGDADAEIADAEQELADGWAEYRDAKETAEQELADARDAIVKGEQQLEDTKAQLSAAQLQLDSGSRQVSEAVPLLEEQLTAAGLDLSSKETALSQLRLALEFGLVDEATYNRGLGAVEQLFSLYALRDSLAEQERQLQQGWAAWNTGVVQLRESYSLYATERARAEQELADAEQELQDGERELADAKQELEQLTEPAVYLLDRSSTVSYTTLETDTDIVQDISLVFPVFFFAVAGLICSTTMSRMVADQRTQIGTMKALGYDRASIMGKYLFYAGGASLLGWGFGFLAGSTLFPVVIWTGYSILYYFAEQVVIVWSFPLAAISLLCSIACCVGTAYLSCRSVLEEVPAQLMRPRAPQSGSRILLERIGFFWNWLSFLGKVSVRNIFRYKKRLVMMILGVGGCTALLLTGFGLRDSIENIVYYQFDEVTHYDISVNFTEPQTEESRAQFLSQVGLTEQDALFVQQSSVELWQNGGMQEVNLVATQNGVEGFVSLRDKAGQTVAWPAAGEAVISSGLADALDIRLGDEITLTVDARTLTLRVSGLFQNYIYHYCFVDSASFLQQTGSAPETKTAYLMAGGQDAHRLAASALGCEGVAAVSVNDDMRQTVDSMLRSLDYIVGLVVLCAAMLVFTVLYNLTNINITERIREIATIKVLGFTQLETVQYVFRENVVLSVAGALLGLPLGRLLHWYVMKQIQINMMTFPVRVLPMSLLGAFLLTVVFAVGVNALLAVRLQKIDMAQSLKSVE